MNTYPFLITSDFVGGLIKIIMGVIVFFNINSFIPSPAEYIIIIMICVYGIISGVINIAPYIDEASNKIIQWVGFVIRSKQTR